MIALIASIVALWVPVWTMAAAWRVVQRILER